MQREVLKRKILKIPFAWDTEFEIVLEWDGSDTKGLKIWVDHELLYTVGSNMYKPSLPHGPLNDENLNWTARDLDVFNTIKEIYNST